MRDRDRLGRGEWVPALRVALRELVDGIRAAFLPGTRVYADRLRAHKVPRGAGTVHGDRPARRPAVPLRRRVTYRAGRTSRHVRARLGKPAHRARTGRLEMPSYVHAHLDFLLLAMIRQAPRDAHSVRRELRERFGARSTPSPQLVYSRLHYLERNRLIRPLPANPRRYLLTVSGQRSLDTRTREWDSFAKGTEVLLQRVRT